MEEVEDQWLQATKGDLKKNFEIHKLALEKEILELKTKFQSLESSDHEVIIIRKYKGGFGFITNTTDVYLNGV